MRTCPSAVQSLTLQRFVSSVLSERYTGETTLVTVLPSKSTCRRQFLGSALSPPGSVFSGITGVSIVEEAELEPVAGTIIPAGPSIRGDGCGVLPLLLLHIDEGRSRLKRAEGSLVWNNREVLKACGEAVIQAQDGVAQRTAPQVGYCQLKDSSRLRQIG